MDLYSLFNPQSIAIIGASDQEGKIGNILVKNLVNFKYAGQIFPINPKYDQILGVRCFPKITEIQQEIDLVLVAVPAKLVYPVIEEAVGRSRNFVVISAGFSEIGQEGHELEQKLRDLAASREINILGPNCLGFLNPKLKLNASFSGDLPQSGSIAFLSQSGALAVALLDQAKEMDLGFSKIVSLGNKMQLGENELVRFLDEDEETKVMGLYLESLEDGPNFLRLTSKISQNKPIVVLKAGKSARAKEAMLSHTGSLAGEAAITSAAFQKSGVIEVESIREFTALLNLISRDETSGNPEALIVTNAGGPGVLATDAFRGRTLELAKISEETKEALGSFLPEEAALSNPIDLLGDALEDRYQKTLEVLEKEKAGVIFCLITPQDQTPVEKIAEVLLDFSRQSQKIIVPVLIGGEKVKEAKKKLQSQGVATFDYPEEAIDTFNRYFDWKHQKNNLFQEVSSDEKRKDLAGKIIERARVENRKMLDVFEAKELLELYDIPASQVSLAEGSGFDFPVVLKVDDEKYAHKTDKGGVALNIKNQEELDEEMGKMKEKFPEARLIVQKQEPQGEELILGIKKDASFGPVAVYGLGGIFTEVFKKIDFIFPGMDQSSIKNSISEGPLGFLFSDFRGMKPLNADEFSKLLEKLSRLAFELPEIREMDINPIFGFRETGKFIAVDTKIMI